MKQAIFHIFQQKEQEATNFVKNWEVVETAIYGRLITLYSQRPDDDELQNGLARLNQERQQLRERLMQAYDELVYSLRNPCLTIATTGTTSSGKSTLVNLLCGADVMPVAADEMSAGVVVIHHSDHRKLVIHKTPEARWDYGEWDDISEDEIRERLTQVMRRYQEVRTASEGFSGACPYAELYYPTYIGNNPELLALPLNCRLRLMDLPGLKFVEDESNSAVIRQSRDALCLVIYNSDEVNPHTQEKLLEQVVDQVRELGGSPARMLFILNRIDSLHRDKYDWPANEERFVSRIGNSIRERLQARLPEYHDANQNISVLRLSTLPALLALQMGHVESERKFKLARHLDNSFGELIDTEVRDNLPRLYERWSQSQFNHVRESVWRASYADIFFDSLRQQINNHFPDLIIPQILQQFRSDVGQTLTEWALQMARAQLKSSKDDYEKESELIDRIRSELDDLCTKGEEQLLRPFEQGMLDAVKHKEGSVTGIREVVYQTEHKAPFCPPPGGKLRRGTLAPFYVWNDEIGIAINALFEEIADELVKGDGSLDDDVMRLLSRDQRLKLRNACKKLIDAGYDMKMAENGDHIETNITSQKEKLHAINQALNNFAGVLKPALETTVQRVSEKEMERVSIALEQMINVYWAHITTQAKLIAPNIGLETPPPPAEDVEDQGPLLLHVGDIKDPSGLAVKLRDTQNPLSKYLRERFSPNLRRLLEQSNKSSLPSESLRTALVDELNRLLKDPFPYEQCCAQITLTYEICELIEQKTPDEDSILLLNRLLLEETYPHEIAKRKKHFSFNYTFHAGFPVGCVTKEEQVGTEQVKVGEKRVWWKIWLGKRDVYETRPVYENRDYETADIPSAYELLANWLAQAKESEPDVVGSFVNWLITHTRGASTRLRQKQQELLDRYKLKLDEANLRAEKIHSVRQEDWTVVLNQAEGFQRSLKLLCPLQSEDGPSAS